MITREKIDRINELSNKKKVMPLSEVELEEQQALRAEYLGALKKNFREQLDLIEIVDQPQCDYKKLEGDNKMKKDDANLGYDNAEELEIKTNGQAGGETLGYDGAEALEERKEDKFHTVMADLDDEIEKDDTPNSEHPYNRAKTPPIMHSKEDQPNLGYDEAEELEIKTNGHAGGETLGYDGAEALEERKEEKIHDLMGDSTYENEK